MHEVKRPLLEHCRNLLGIAAIFHTVVDERNGAEIVIMVYLNYKNPLIFRGRSCSGETMFDADFQFGERIQLFSL